MVISVYACRQLLGASPPDPLQSSALDSTGGLMSPVPRFCPPPKQISSYAPCIRYAQKLTRSRLQPYWSRTKTIFSPLAHRTVIVHVFHVIRQGAPTLNNRRTSDVRSPAGAAHVYAAIFELGLPLTLGRGPENFVMISIANGSGVIMLTNRHDVDAPPSWIWRNRK